MLDYNSSYMFRPNCLKSVINCTVHLFKDLPEDGPTIGPKHVAGIIIQYNLIKYKAVYYCITYILYFILAYIQS